MLSEVDFLSMSGIMFAKSVCYIETGHEFHFLLDLTYTMGIVYFLWADDWYDIDLVQS